MEQQTSATAKYGNVSLDSISVIGTTPDFPSVRDVQVANGRFFTAQDLEHTSKVAVLGSAAGDGAVRRRRSHRRKDHRRRHQADRHRRDGQQGHRLRPELG